MDFQVADEEKEDVPEEKDVEVDEEASVILTANPAMTKRKLSKSDFQRVFLNIISSKLMPILEDDLNIKF